MPAARSFAASLVSVAALVAAAPAAASGPGRPTGNAGGRAAVERARALTGGRGVRSGRELTGALADVYAALPQLSGDDRLEAHALLARPDDDQPDPGGTHKYSVPPAVVQKYCTAHFCVHYVKSTRDAPDQTDNVGPDGQAPPDAVPDYVDQMASILENEVFPCENGTGDGACSMTGGGWRLGGSSPGLGWTLPVPDNGLGGDDRLDVYIEDLFPSGIFGYVALDPTQKPSARSAYGYMVVDKDFSRFANGDPAGGLADERVTIAHEYNHLLQNAYDFAADKWMFETTAVYMEEKAYPAINGYLDYLPAWAQTPQVPLTSFPDQPPASLRPYGSAVWNHWLDHRYGPSIVRAAWEIAAPAGDFAAGAYGQAVTTAGGAGFGDEFDRFATATAEWNAPGSGFPDAYPDVARSGFLSAGSQSQAFTLPHATFALFDVPIPPTAPTAIRVTASLPADTSGAVALVGRTGPNTNDGTVTTNLTELPAGGSSCAQLDSPSTFGRLTAVVVNSDVSRSGFDQSARDWVYTHDAPAVTARVDGPGAPTATTGAPQATTDHTTTVGALVDPVLTDTTWSIEYGKTSAYGARSARQALPASTACGAAVAAGLSGLAANTLYHYRAAASNAFGSAHGADATFRTARDVTPPIVELKVARRARIGRVVRKGLAFKLRCSERCAGTARIVLGRRAARKLGLPALLGKLRVNLAPRRAFAARRLKLGVRARSRIAALKRVDTTLTVRLSDASRNSRKVHRRVTLRH